MAQVWRGSCSSAEQLVVPAHRRRRRLLIRCAAGVTCSFSWQRLIFVRLDRCDKQKRKLVVADDDDDDAQPEEVCFIDLLVSQSAIMRRHPQHASLLFSFLVSIDCNWTTGSDYEEEEEEEEEKGGGRRGRGQAAQENQGF